LGEKASDLTVGVWKKKKCRKDVQARCEKTLTHRPTGDGEVERKAKGKRLEGREEKPSPNGKISEGG